MNFWLVSPSIFAKLASPAAHNSLQLGDPEEQEHLATATHEGDLLTVFIKHVLSLLKK